MAFRQQLWAARDIGQSVMRIRNFAGIAEYLLLSTIEQPFKICSHPLGSSQGATDQSVPAKQVKQFADIPTVAGARITVHWETGGHAAAPLGFPA